MKTYWSLVQEHTAWLRTIDWRDFRNHVDDEITDATQKVWESRNDEWTIPPALPSTSPDVAAGDPKSSDSVTVAEWEARLVTACSAALKFIDTLDLMGCMSRSWPTPLTPNDVLQFQRDRADLVMRADDLFEALQPVDDELTETAAKTHKGAVLACRQSGPNAHAATYAIGQPTFFNLSLALGGTDSIGDPMKGYRQPLSDENRSRVEGALSPLAHEDLQRLRAQVKGESTQTANRLREELLHRQPGSNTSPTGDSEDGATKKEASKKGGEPSEPRKTRRTISKPLTDKQAEALQVVAECQGNYTKAGKRMGIGRKAAEQRYKAAMKKMGKKIIKHATEQMPVDLRGQPTVDAESDQKLGGSGGI